MSTEPLSSFVCDLGKVDVSRACPINGDYVLQFTDFEVKEAKNNQGNNLFLTFATTGPCQSIPDGAGQSRTINPGYKIKECCLLWQHPNMETPWQVKLALIIDALLGTNNDTRPTSIDWNSLKGKTLQVSLKAESDPEYGMQPRIKKFSPPPSV